MVKPERQILQAVDEARVDARLKTGYASLEAIMEMSPDFIKTDMVLVRAMGAIAESIGAQVVAEGIETEGEIHALRDLGVRFGQGIFFGAALKADD
jgi:EAL domain-containing protein (putative c-di-GMP-specific phosphodiesterase class I)